MVIYRVQFEVNHSPISEGIEIRLEYFRCRMAAEDFAEEMNGFVEEIEVL